MLQNETQGKHFQSLEAELQVLWSNGFGRDIAQLTKAPLQERTEELVRCQQQCAVQVTFTCISCHHFTLLCVLLSERGAIGGAS